MIQNVLKYGGSLMSDYDFIKLLIYEDGTTEEIQQEGSLMCKVKGYGVNYSHPRHLRNCYGYKINNFKEMDLALDDMTVLRALKMGNKLELNCGNKITKDQLKLVEKYFKEKPNTFRAKITSISRKWYKNFDDFKQALIDKNYLNEIHDENKEFKTHMEALIC